MGLFIFLVPVGCANAKPIYDISSYQGYLSGNQVRHLKHEVPFMILKAENGGVVTDTEFHHNASEMSAHHIPYGAYDYSVYANAPQARGEALALYYRAPHARFYVNDSERNNAGTDLNHSTYDWASEIHHLTRKPAVLYSDLAFMNHFSPAVLHHYDALWVAAYGSQPHPWYSYDLWQYTDHHYSPALREWIDASIFPSGRRHRLAFWIGHRRSNRNRPNNDLVVIINGRRERLLRSKFRRGTWKQARKTGFNRGFIHHIHVIFDRYRPDYHRALIPRWYRLHSHRTLWLVGKKTHNAKKFKHIRQIYLYYRRYHGWLRTQLR